MVEAVAFVVDEAAAASREGVFLDDGYVEAGFGETGGGADAADAGAWEECLLGSMVGRMYLVCLTYRSRWQFSAEASRTFWWWW